VKIKNVPKKIIDLVFKQVFNDVFVNERVRRTILLLKITLLR